jgi:hypothetical protein
MCPGARVHVGYSSLDRGRINGSLKCREWRIGDEADRNRQVEMIQNLTSGKFGKSLLWVGTPLVHIRFSLRLGNRVHCTYCFESVARTQSEDRRP